MAHRRIILTLPVQIACCYILWLALPVLVCFWLVGAQTFAERAVESRPYAILFSPAIRETLSSFPKSTNGDTEKRSVILLGDSNNIWPDGSAWKSGPAENDLGALLCEVLSRESGLPKVTISEWAYPAASMFDHYCMFYMAMKFSPDIIIVPINWRGFGTQWLRLKGNTQLPQIRLNPELSAFVPINEALGPGYESPLRSRGISRVRQLEYRLDILSLYPAGVRAWALGYLKSFGALSRLLMSSELNGESNPNSRPSLGIGDAKETAADKPESIKNGKLPEGKKGSIRVSDKMFPMEITRTNPTFVCFRALAHAASKRNAKILFYIWPLDPLCLDTKAPAFQASKELLIQVAQEENAYCVDLSDLLTHEYFFDILGHCEVNGRRKVAEALVPDVARILQISNRGFLRGQNGYAESGSGNY